MSNHVKNPNLHSLSLSIFHLYFPLSLDLGFLRGIRTIQELTFINPLANFFFFAFTPFSKKTKSSLCNRPPRSRSGIYTHQITNQIPSFSRSDATCSSVAKINLIQRWTRRHALFDFPVVQSMRSTSFHAPHAHRITFPCHVNSTRISDLQFS